jgi:glycosyltransferase involved in cell wall biosynthesis
MDISIILPYDKDRGFLQRMIDSIEAQKFSGTFELVLAQGDKPVTQNFNDGLKRAKGKYFKLAGEDDTHEPNSLQHLFNGIQGYDICIGNARYTRDRGFMIYKPEYWDLKRVAEKNSINGGAIMYKTSIVRAIGGMDESLWTGEEYDMNMKLLSLGHTVNYIDKVVYNTYVWGGQKSMGYRKKDPIKRQAEIERIQNKYK